MADRIPDEIVSEIISPLLKHPDQVFADTSAKPLTAAGYSSSTYLLVCKSWLRVATPLLYNVIILRKRAQADALSLVLLNNPEIGLFIRKLRVEGGFGTAMLHILRKSPNITDLHLSLIIWSSDSAGGLCEGLVNISPRRVLLVDGHVETKPKPMKNQAVTSLLTCLVDRIPKWDKLEIFHFPYVARNGTPFLHAATHTLLHERAKILAAALVQSKSIRTLFIEGCGVFPEYFLPMTESLKCIRIKLPRDDEYSDLNSKLKEIVRFDSKLNKIVEFDEETEELLDSESFPTSVRGSEELKTLSRSNSAPTIQWLEVSFELDQPPPRKSWTATNPALVSAFTAVTRLNWSTPQHFSFPALGAGFIAFPKLTSLDIWECTPSVVKFFTQLPLDQLRIARLSESSGDVASAVAFVHQHGVKLTELSFPLEVFLQTNLKVFDDCPNLENLSILRPLRNKAQRTIPDDVFARTVPHTKLTKIHVGYYAPFRQTKPTLTQLFQMIDKSNFPALKDITMPEIQWPMSEKQVAKNDYVGFAEILRTKGIRLIDEESGWGWVPQGTV